MATHSSILTWRIPWTEEPGGLQSTGSQRVGHYWATNTFTFFFMPLGLWDLSSPTRDWTRASAVKALSPNRWTTREFPTAVFLILKVLNKWAVQIFKVGTAEELSGLRAQQCPQRPQHCQQESRRRWFNWCKLPVGFGQWSRLNSVFPQNSYCLDPQNVILFENRVFADIIKLRWSHTGLECVLNVIWLMSF